MGIIVHIDSHTFSTEETKLNEISRECILAYY